MIPPLSLLFDFDTPSVVLRQTRPTFAFKADTRRLYLWHGEYDPLFGSGNPASDMWIYSLCVRL